MSKSQTPRKTRQTKHLIILAIFGVCAALYVANFDSMQIGQTFDSSSYVSAGRSLATGLGYTRFEHPLHVFESKYPPGLPALVAVVYALGGGLDALHVIPFIFAIIALWLAYLFYRHRLPLAGMSRAGAWPYLLVALFGLNHLIVGFAGQLMSEMPFICMVLAVIAWADRIHGDSENLSPLRWALLMGILIAIAGLFRSIGYVLIPAIAGWLWISGRRKRSLLTVGFSVLALAPWFTVQAVRSGQLIGSGYQSDITVGGQTQWGPLMRPLENFIVYASGLVPRTIVPFFGDRVQGLAETMSLGFVPPLAGWIVTAAIIAGAVIYARHRSDPASWVCVFMVAAMLVWPFRYTRFVLPILPILTIYLLQAGQVLLRHRQRWLYALAALCLVGFVGRDVQMVQHPPRQNYPDVRARAEFVAQNTPADAVIFVPNAPGHGLYADRKFIRHQPAPDAPSPRRMAEILLDRPLYLLVCPKSDRERFAEVLGHPACETIATHQAIDCTLHRISGVPPPLFPGSPRNAPPAERIFSAPGRP